METQNPINPYAQSVLATQTEGVPTAVVANQPFLIMDPKIFKTTPVSLTCLFCNKPMTTKVNTTWNNSTCLFCCYLCPCCYCCIQSYRGKDFCCFDAIHRCPHCKNVVGTYTSC